MTRSLQGPGRDNETDPFASLVREVADLKRRIDDATAQVLRMAGLRAEPGALLVEGALNVTGPMTVGGTLSLPAGIIDNDALANPVAFAGNKGSAPGTVPPVSWGIACSADMIVPDWATSAVVLAVGYVYATGSEAGSAVTAEITIGGESIGTMLMLLPNTTDRVPLLAERIYNPTGTSIPVNVRWFRDGAISSASASVVTIAVVSR